MEKTQDVIYFNTLYAEYKERFLRFARSYVTDPDVAEDILTESLMYYWENRAGLLPDSNIPVWLLTVIKHKCLNYLHRLRTRETAEDYLSRAETWELNLRIATLEACDPEKLFSDEVQRIIDDTLSVLPEQTREIFVESRYRDRSHKDIAEQFGLSTKSVEYHITKTLKVLRTALKDYFPL